MNLSPTRENVLTTPKFSTETPEKSPSTVAGVAFSIANAWCDVFQRSACV